MRRTEHVRLWEGRLRPLARWLALAALVLAGGAAGACATKRPAPEAAAEAAPQVPYDRTESLASFEVVWTTVKEKHWDPTLGGLDWEAVHAELLPKMEAATTMTEGRAVMQEMLGRLHQSHFGILPQEVYLREETPSDEPEKPDAAAPPAPVHADAPAPARKKEIGVGGGRDTGTTGFDVRVAGDHALVTRVATGSSAEQAGIKPGWLMVSADGQDIERLARRLKDSKLEALPRDSALGILLQHLLRGDVGDVMKLEMLDGADQKVEKEVTLTELPGTPEKFGNLPTIYLDVEARLLQENVEYFRLNIFLNPTRVGIAQTAAMAQAKDADGFIIDLRGNPGGLGLMAMGMGGWFVEEDDIKLGTMYTRDSSINFVLNPRLHTFAGPLAILVDGMSGSTSEIFAGGMKDIGRARIFGEPTMGAALPSVIEVLPNGDRFQYAIANYISAGGKPLEGNGVQPDEVVPPDRATLLAGRDPVIEAALKWIKAEKAKGAAAGAGESGKK